MIIPKNSFASNLSRRDFLEITGTTFLSVLMTPYITKDWLSFRNVGADELKHKHGRVISTSVDVYQKPSIDSKLITTLWQDAVLPIESVTISNDEKAYNRIWYEFGNAGFTHSGKIQPVDIKPNSGNEFISKDGVLVELTVPFTDAIWHPKSPHLVAYRLYFGTVYWATDVIQDKNGKLWYKIPDDKWDIDYYVEASHMHIIQPEEISPLSPHVPEYEKRIEIILKEQAVIAYEYNQPVFLARTATGARFIDGDFRTSPGNYITNRKRPSRHMAAGDPAASNSYDLPGIPWICYLTESGISFHGTYWHNDFGKPRSHGCINLTQDDARWIYRWTNPNVPTGQRIRNAKDGTKVTII